MAAKRDVVVIRPSGPGVEGWCAALVRAYEERTAAYAAEVAARSACGAGCSDCCHLPVLATWPEVLRIAAHVRAAWSAERVDALRARLKAHAVATRLASGRFDYRARVACPLLDEAGRCGVYEVRPLHCRGWNSRDAGACRRQREEPDAEVEIPQDVRPTVVAVQVGEGLHEALRAAGLASGEVRLAKGLREALESGRCEL